MNILITGASKGIGYELVKKFAEDSSNQIVAVARNIDLLENLKQECIQDFNNSIHICSIDFLSDSFLNDFNQILSKHNFSFDILINNAGLLFNQSFTLTTIEQIKNTFDVNFFRPFQIIQLIVSQIEKNKSCHVVNIGSMGGFQGSQKFPGLSIYSSSKAALANLTECLAEEYKDSNITFNCLALGSVQTEMLKDAFPNYKAQLLPEQIAIFIKDFALNGSQYFNGKIIPISISTP